MDSTEKETAAQTEDTPAGSVDNLREDTSADDVITGGTEEAAGVKYEGERTANEEEATAGEETTGADAETADPGDTEVKHREDSATQDGATTEENSVGPQPYWHLFLGKSVGWPCHNPDSTSPLAFSPLWLLHA